jgi:shikimate dehydrogenase
MTDVYGIIGNPIGHSRSAAMHNRAFAALGLDAVYVPFDVLPAQLTAAVAGVRALGLRGLNVTLPHKTTIMALLDRVDPEARAIGAVNTVWFDGAGLCGTNTDAPGLRRALEEGGVQLRGASVTVLGAGGAARAALIGVAQAGAKQIHVTARRAGAAHALVSELATVAGPAELTACAWDPPVLQAVFAQTDLLIQATSATLDDGPAALALAAALPWSALPQTAAVVDLVYRPIETTVLRAAKQTGLRTLDGLGMLLHQGAIAFERWTGRSAPLSEMRAALQT